MWCWPTMLAHPAGFKAAADPVCLRLRRNRCGSEIEKELKWFSRRESNPHHQFRKLRSCPLDDKKVVRRVGLEPTLILGRNECDYPLPTSAKLVRRRGVEPPCILYAFSCLEGRGDTDARILDLQPPPRRSWVLMK